MATIPGTITPDASMRGVSNTIANFVVENETITETDRFEEVPDQQGAIAGEISYDKRHDLRVTVHAATSSADAPTTAGKEDFSYAGKKWKVDTVEEAGSYNGLRRWNITAHRYANYPTQGA